MWALRRRLVYTFFFLLFLSFGSFFFFREQLIVTPTCSDGVQNGEETGVDCGSSCNLICSSDRSPVETVWATTFLNDDKTYDVGILLRNKNSGSAPKMLTLTIVLKSESDETLYEQKVETPVPLSSEFPIVIQSLKLSKVPKRVVLVKEEDPSYLLKNLVLNPVSTEASFNKNSKQSVFVTLHNNTKKDLLRFPVRVVLYDGKKNAIGVAESFVDRLLRGGTQTVEVVLGKRYDTEPDTVRAFTVFDPYAF